MRAYPYSSGSTVWGLGRRVGYMGVSQDQGHRFGDP